MKTNVRFKMKIGEITHNVKIELVGKGYRASAGLGKSQHEQQAVGITPENAAENLSSLVKGEII